MIAAPVDSIFNQASTGTGSVHELGKDGTPGGAKGIGKTTRILQFITAGTFTCSIEASLDGTNYFDWVAAFANTDGDALIIEDGPINIRVNVSAISGNLQVYAQKFIAE